VKREGRRSYVILACDEVSVERLPETGSAVGVDMGVVSFLTTSDGAQVDNPRHLSASAGRLAVAQRSLAACKRGSNRRRKVRERVAAIHGKVRRQRADHAHKDRAVAGPPPRPDRARGPAHRQI
jgi:putative transposase